jgi:uncharacterized protein (DUF2236 family)
MNYFVKENSIVRKIWGKTDTILFIFGGSAAEFALNKAVDWLYFTGKLPQDPIGRLFSTVVYAQQIIFEEETKAIAALNMIKTIHQNVENKRGASIPDWAYRDVLYMLVYYSIAAFEILERKLSTIEKEELYDVFKRVGIALGLTNLPYNYEKWLIDRELHLESDLVYSHFTSDLLMKYKQNLGAPRYAVLVEIQTILLPKKVLNLLKFDQTPYINPALFIYKHLKTLTLIKKLKYSLLPLNYRDKLTALEK